MQRKITFFGVAAALFMVMAMGSPMPHAQAATCTPTGFFRDGINMTAAQIGGDVPGTLDATGCNIGVYYGPGMSGTVSGEVFGANYFGVAVRQGINVNVVNANIHDIGESPLNGSQHGLGVYFATVDNGSASAQPACTTGTTSGSVINTTVSRYQKGGIVINCTGTAVTVDGGATLGEGPVSYIAQNGIQVSRGATAQVTNVTITGHDYTPAAWVSCGLLYFDADGVRASGNKYRGNERNLCNVGRGGGQFDN